MRGMMPHVSLFNMLVEALAAKGKLKKPACLGERDAEARQQVVLCYAVMWSTWGAQRHSLLIWYFRGGFGYSRLGFRRCIGAVIYTASVQ